MPTGQSVARASPLAKLYSTTACLADRARPTLGTYSFVRTYVRSSTRYVSAKGSGARIAYCTRYRNNTMSPASSKKDAPFYLCRVTTPGGLHII